MRGVTHHNGTMTEEEIAIMPSSSYTNGSSRQYSSDHNYPNNSQVNVAAIKASVHALCHHPTFGRRGSQQYKYISHWSIWRTNFGENFRWCVALNLKKHYLKFWKRACCTHWKCVTSVRIYTLRLGRFLSLSIPIWPDGDSIYSEDKMLFYPTRQSKYEDWRHHLFWIYRLSVFSTHGFRQNWWDCVLSSNPLL